MDKNDLTLLFAYNRWANGRVLEASRQLIPEQRIAPAQVSFGSLMGTLVHILGAEMNWRLRMQEGISPTRMVTPAEFPSLEILASRWGEEETAMQGFIQSLRPEDVNRWVEFNTTSGRPQGATLWKALAHLVNHGTQFRGEAGVVLTNFGRSPGDLDMILYLRESDQR
jgi:uncharacterized damage-inducible protein DinB